MNRNDDILNFLVEGLIAPQRDLVTRAFYKFAEGDPNSAPVNEAILLTACARRVSQAPQELREASSNFQQVVTKASDLERRMIERTDQNNASVVAEFKDETRRANDTLREIVSLGNITIDRGKKIDQMLKPLAVSLERITDKVYILNENLRENHESATKTAEAADKIHKVYETTLEPVKALTREVRYLLATGGFLGGLLFDQLANQTELVPWVGLAGLFLILGWLKYLLRKSWKAACWLAEKWKSSVKPWLRLLLL